MLPPGNRASSTSPGEASDLIPAFDVTDEMLDLGQGLESEFRSMDAGRFADAPEVVAFEVHQHSMLRSFLLIEEELLHQLPIEVGILTAGGGSLDRRRCELDPLDMQQLFRTG